MMVENALTPNFDNSSNQTQTAQTLSNQTALNILQGNNESLLNAAHLGLGIAAIGTGIGEFSNVIEGKW